MHRGMAKAEFTVAVADKHCGDGATASRNNGPAKSELTTILSIIRPSSSVMQRYPLINGRTTSGGKTYVPELSSINKVSRYLNEPAPSDDDSGWWSVNLSDSSPVWIEQFGKTANKVEQKLTGVVLHTPFKHQVPDQRDKIPVLTVGKLGDWHGRMKEITYLVMVVDAARDIMMNALWQLNTHRSDKPEEGLGFLIYVVNLLMSDPVQAEALTGVSGFLTNLALKWFGYSTFNELKISPVAWASRSTRTLAIAGAQKSVIICQQMIVDYFPAREQRYQDGLVAKVNEKLGSKHQDNKWDGCIWPFGKNISTLISGRN
jgi:hypothetical protein